MTPLQHYIAEEIATDHVDGLLTRREAMRRLALLGLSGAAAAALIAACGGKQTSRTNPQSGSATTTQPPGMDKALATVPIFWPGPNGQLEAAWAEAVNARGGVLVIHENKGLND
jgi:carboxymethylenebutenolidase